MMQGRHKIILISDETGKDLNILLPTLQVKWLRGTDNNQIICTTVSG